jgi:hypothetical protein
MTIASKLLSNGADQQLIVKEIRGGGAPAVVEKPSDEPKEIPPVEPEPEIEPVVAYVEPDPIETLDDYLPPPLPDFNGDLPPPPDTTAAEFSEVITPVEPENVPVEPPETETPTANNLASLPPPPETNSTPPPVAPVEPPPTPEPPKTVEITDTSTSDPTQFHIPV